MMFTTLWSAQAAGTVGQCLYWSYFWRPSRASKGLVQGSEPLASEWGSLIGGPKYWTIYR